MMSRCQGRPHFFATLQLVSAFYVIMNCCCSAKMHVEDYISATGLSQLHERASAIAGVVPNAATGVMEVFNPVNSTLLHYGNLRDRRLVSNSQECIDIINSRSFDSGGCQFVKDLFECDVDNLGMLDIIKICGNSCFQDLVSTLQELSELGCISNCDGCSDVSEEQVCYNNNVCKTPCSTGEDCPCNQECHPTAGVCGGVPESDAPLVTYTQTAGLLKFMCAENAFEESCYRLSLRINGVSVREACDVVDRTWLSCKADYVDFEEAMGFAENVRLSHLCVSYGIEFVEVSAASLLDKEMGALFNSVRLVMITAVILLVPGVISVAY